MVIEADMGVMTAKDKSTQSMTDPLNDALFLVVL
jgi:hypothetical protein